MRTKLKPTVSYFLYSETLKSWGSLMFATRRDAIEWRRIKNLRGFRVVKARVTEI